jgi:hypothetical protein
MPPGASHDLDPDFSDLIMDLAGIFIPKVRIPGRFEILFELNKSISAIETTTQRCTLGYNSIREWEGILTIRSS